MKITNALQRFFNVFGAAYQSLWHVRALSWVAILLIGLIGFFAIMLHSEKINFAFEKQQCLQGLVLLPGAQKNTNSMVRVSSYGKLVTIAGHAIIARSTCYEFKNAPKEKSSINVSQALFGLGVLSKNGQFNVSEYPKPLTAKLPATISITAPLVFELTRADRFFTYTLQTGQTQANCTAKGNTMACDVAPLHLEHSKSYEFSLVQSFNNVPIHVMQNIKAVTANSVVLTSGSVASYSTVYDKPSQMTIVADRDLQSADGVMLTAKTGSESPKNIAVTSKITGNTITVSWSDPLPRTTDFELTVGAANTPDGGTLEAPFKTIFKTSGGPKVVATNIRDRAVPLGQRIVLTLDQAMQPGQNLNALFGIKVGTVGIPATITISGKTVTITPQSAFGACVGFQVWEADGALSNFGVGGGSAWTFNSRSTCAVSFSIGTSVKGRSIVAYKFGTGSSTVLFTGNLHGNESNTKRLLDIWMDEIEGNPGKIPAGKSIVVIPLSNPDGYAANTRTNANTIDLNRNFPANNWKSSVKMPSGETLATGGGVTSLSEPESKALANYVGSLGPRLVMSYHSMGDVVVANDAGNSWSLTRTYSSKSGYGAENGSTIGNFFDYDTTGAFEDWLYDKKGIAAILVELATRTSDEFYRNKNAMWQVVADF